MFRVIFRFSKFPLRPHVRFGQLSQPLFVLSRFRPATRVRCLSNHVPPSNEFTPLIDSTSFETVCSETLDSLSEYFEELIEEAPHLDSADVAYSDGVLTVKFGNSYGTYVINRQSPNRQLWLSSPLSGPKRYDYIPQDSSGYWIYRHDNTSLHELLEREVADIVNGEVKFTELPHGSRK